MTPENPPAALPSPGPSRGSPVRLFAFVLAAAFLVRLPVVLFEEPAGRDIAEYRDIARRLTSGEGFTLSIKAYHAAETPAVHSAMHERTPLPAILLAGLSLPVGPDLAVRWLGPLLALAMIAALTDLTRRRLGEQEAWIAGLLLAIQPGLFEVSLTPLSEIAMLAALAGALWAAFGIQSAAAAGLFCALAVLARPNSILHAMILAAALALQGRRNGGAARPLARFAAALALGPAAIVALNLAAGSPPLLLPQSFLFRVARHTDRLHYFHQGEVYGSAFEFLRGHAPEAVKLAVKNAFYYLKSLAAGPGGTGYLLPLLPLAAAGWAVAGPPSFLAVLAAMGLLDFAFYSAAWATFDSGRFMALPMLALTLCLPAGCAAFPALRSGAGTGLRFLRAGAPGLLALGLAIPWAAGDAFRGYLAWREHSLGRGLSNNIEAVWTAPGVEELARELAKALSEGPIPKEAPILSNEPWLMNRLTGNPAVLAPYDASLEDAESLLRRFKPWIMTIHAGDWPEAAKTGMENLRAAAWNAGWRPSGTFGRFEVWRARQTPGAN